MTHEHPAPSVHHIVPGFGADRAAHYDTQASVNLVGFQAASLLFLGLGMGAELMPYTRFNVPGWRFTGVDPSDATLPPGPPFDGAQMMGLPGNACWMGKTGGEFPGRAGTV